MRYKKLMMVWNCLLMIWCQATITLNRSVSRSSSLQSSPSTHSHHPTGRRQTNSEDHRQAQSREKRQQGVLPRIIGIRSDSDNKRVYIDSDGVTVIPAEEQITLLMYGENLATNMYVVFTRNSMDVEQGDQKPSCSESLSNSFPLTSLDSSMPPGTVARTTVNLKVDGESVYYVCLKLKNNTPGVFQGSEPWMRVRAEGRMMPIYIQVLLIMILLIMSGLFSGLNLGLMALDKNELAVLSRVGTETEKKYAAAIAPVRKRGNYLLCSLLLGNVLVNTTLTILLDDLTSGIIAVVGSTLSIVTFGEIVPQAVCSRHGLAVGAKTVWLTYIFMIATFPLSYPISKVLDKILGEEIGNVYDRERLMEYIRITKDYNQLKPDEMNIISGALRIRQIKVCDIMTKIEDVFMLPITAKLDFETINQIMMSGYSRIPIYDGERNNIVALLYAKDLSFVDSEDKTPLKSHIEFYKHPLYFVYEDVTLDLMLNEFKEGKSHIAFVRRIVDDGLNDPVYKLSGIVTMEDVIEEIIQAEIVDETDIITDNRAKKKRKEALSRRDFSDFVRLGPGQEGVQISPQLALATFRYLSTSVEPFTSRNLTENVLRRLMAQRIYFEVKIDPKFFLEPDSAHKEPPRGAQLYTAGVPADYFIMILEGRVRVLVSKEVLQFDSGPFSYFGVPALLDDNQKINKSTSLGRLSLADGISQDQATAFQQRTPEMSCKPPIPPTALASRGSQDFHQSNHQLVSGQAPVSTPPSQPGVYVPDYSVICVETTCYMLVPRHIYKAALRATQLERKRDSQNVGDPEEDIVDRELNSAFVNWNESKVAGDQTKKKTAETGNPKPKTLPNKQLSGSSLPTIEFHERHSNNSTPDLVSTDDHGQGLAAGGSPSEKSHLI